MPSSPVTAAIRDRSRGDGGTCGECRAKLPDLVGEAMTETVGEDTASAQDYSQR